MPKRKKKLSKNPRPKRQSKRPEKPASGVRGRKPADLRFQKGLRLLRTENSVAAAAHKAGISPAKLRTYAVRKKVLVKRGKGWVVKKDVPRKLLIYSDGKEQIITVGKFRTASRIGAYMAAVRWFIQTNDLSHLAPFAGKSVKDGSGKSFPFETRPNVLHRLASSGGSSFEDIYRLVI